MFGGLRRRENRSWSVVWCGDVVWFFFFSFFFFFFLVWGFWFS